MVSHLFFYQLALITLMWLFFLLFYAWPSERARRPPLAASITPPRPRSNAPKPFAGLPQKPSCALCEQDILSPQAPPAVRPDPIPPPHRRSRTVDTSQHFCPHTGCRYRGWLGLGNLRANGHPSGGPWRQFHCTACKGYFPEHHGTLFHGKQIAVELIVRVLACLAEDLGIRATARVFEVNPNTVLQWLGKAVDQLQAFAHYFLCEIHVRQLQVDELYAVLKAMKAGDLSEDEAIRRLSPSPHWVWTAMDPETKLLLVSDVGTHTLAMAQRVLHQVAHCLAPDCVPLFLSDGCKDYLPAILTHFGCWSHPKRHHAKGPAPQPRWRPRPELLRHGLLRGSFIPSKPQRQLRELTRYRSTLVQDHARTLNRLQAVLEDANLKLASVVTDIYGVSARAMLAAILNGQRDVETLADLARGRLRAKRDQRKEALEGRVTAHHSFLLTEHLSTLEYLDKAIARISGEIDQRLTAEQEAIALLDTIPGVGQWAAEILIAEMGTDMSRFPSAKHLASWAGMCPGNHESGGKHLSGKIRKGNRWLRQILVEMAHVASKTKNTYLAAQYKRLAARRGKKRALIAVGHTILTLQRHLSALPKFAPAKWRFCRGQ